MNRPRWPVPDRDELVSGFATEHDETRADRISRYEFVHAEFDPPAEMLLVGGIPAMFAINELKSSFVGGNFLAVILLAQIFVEHSLGGSFLIAGDDKVAEGGLAKMINEGVEGEWIASDEAERLHELRTMRNPYTHPVADMKSRGYLARLQKSGSYDPHDLAENDARRAIEIVVDFVRAGSPNWMPPGDSGTLETDSE